MYSIRIPFKITLVNDKFGSKFHLLRQMIYRYTPRKKKTSSGVTKSFVLCNNSPLKEFLIGCIFYKVPAITTCFSEIRRQLVIINQNWLILFEDGIKRCNELIIDEACRVIKYLAIGFRWTLGGESTVTCHHSMWLYYSNGYSNIQAHSTDCFQLMKCPLLCQYCRQSSWYSISILPSLMLINCFNCYSGDTNNH